MRFLSLGKVENFSVIFHKKRETLIISLY